MNAFANGSRRSSRCWQVSQPGCFFSVAPDSQQEQKRACRILFHRPGAIGGVGLRPNSCSLGARAPSKLSLGISGTTTHRAILFPLAAVSTHPAAEQPASQHEAPRQPADGWQRASERCCAANPQPGGNRPRSDQQRIRH